MDILKGQSGPKKMLIITDIPPEYEGRTMQVFALAPSDPDGKHPCVGGIPESVNQGKAKSFLFDVGTVTNSEKEATAMAIKTVMGAGKPCDSKERIVALGLSSMSEPAGGHSDMNALWEEGMDNIFIYTKGIDICKADADEASINAATLYSFSETESTLKFSDFMRVSDCKMFMDLIRGALNGSEKYVVINEDALIIRKDIFTLEGKEKAKYALNDIINVILPKQTENKDGYLWTKVYLNKDKNERGWMTEVKYKNSTAQQPPNAESGIKFLPSKIDREDNQDNIKFLPYVENEKIYMTPVNDEKCPSYNETNWKEYFVIIKGNATFKIRTTSNNDNDNNVVKKLKAGDIIKVIWPKENENHSRRIGDGDPDGDYSFVKVYYDDDNGKKKCGWAVEKKYLRPDEEWIHPNEPVVTTFENYPDKLYIKETTENKKKKIVITQKKLSGKERDIGWWATTSSDKTKKLEKDLDGRYIVYVGPRILYKNYPNNGPLEDDDFNGFSRYIEVELEDIAKRKTRGEKRIIKCIVINMKLHTYDKYKDGHESGFSDFDEARSELDQMKGVMQTGIRYPKASYDKLAFAYDPENKLGEKTPRDNIDGSVIEFSGYASDENDDSWYYTNMPDIHRKFNPRNYKIIKVTSNVKIENKEEREKDLFINKSEEDIKKEIK